MEDPRSSLGDKLIEFGRKNLLILGLFFVGLIFLGYGLIALIGGASRPSSDIVFESSQDANLSSASTSAQASVRDIVVDVEGAVVKPGVHHVPSDARIQEALIKAGGLSEAADRNWVAKNLNLAVKLIDGAKIYIPRVGEELKSITLRWASPNFAGQAGTTGNFGGEQININTASEEMLDSLPGVGPATAQKIINGRPYSSIEDLIAKKVVTQRVFEQIKDRISIY